IAAVAEMEEGLELLRQDAGPDGSADRYAIAAFRMVLSFARATPSRRLREMLVSFSLQTLRYSKLGFTVARRRKESLVTWQRLVGFFKSNDVIGARTLIEEHIDGSYRLVVSVMKDQSKVISIKKSSRGGKRE
ncbi:MAG: FCD domain-containing protein, partial [Burkholderiaceae bacterium]